MKRENIKQIAMEEKVMDQKVFIAFLSKRFPDESDNIKSYFREWATRFNSGHPENYMDMESLKVYREVREC